MFVVLDVNEVWRLKPFQALSQIAPVLGISPQDVLTTLRKNVSIFPLYKLSRSEANCYTLSVQLPPSWASKLAVLAQPLLWRVITHECKRNKINIEFVVVTTPHYRELLKYVPTSIKVIYYVSDDYRQYQDWDPKALISWEMKVMQRVDFAFFVSQPLAERARSEYPQWAGKVHISMNATEQAFIVPQINPFPYPPEPYSNLKRPLAGVIGTINESLDFDLLYQCANLPELGTLVLVGPVLQSNCSILNSLKIHPKVVFTGMRPHDELPQWMQAIDVALIPYHYTAFNYGRSPMRLFDHLAAGHPIVATSACEQVNDFRKYVRVSNTREEFIRNLHIILCYPEDTTRRFDRIAYAKKNTWEKRMEAFYEVVTT